MILKATKIRQSKYLSCSLGLLYIKILKADKTPWHDYFPEALQDFHGCGRGINAAHQTRENVSKRLRFDTIDHRLAQRPAFFMMRR